MSKKKVYENVGQKRLACMKSVMKSRVQEFARNNGYRIATWNVPAHSDATWQITLKSVNGLKPDMNFTARVSHNSQNKRLSIELVRMPAFVSTARAIEEVNSVYRSCRA